MGVQIAGVQMLGIRAAGAQTYTDLDGDWQARFGKKDRGAAFLELGEPESGDFSVEGHGMTLGLGSFFEVDPNQFLTRDSGGGISGSLALSEEGGDPNAPGPLGSLEIESGKVTDNLLRFTWKGVRRPVFGDDLKVTLKGTRAPAAGTIPRLEGKTTRGRVSGGRLKSRNYEVLVTFDALGFPFYAFEGSGPMTVDGVELGDVKASGRFVLDEKQRLYGTFESRLLGSGLLEGSLKVSNRLLVPVLKMKVTTAERRFHVKGTLDKAVSALLEVSPTTGSFGGTPVGGSSVTTFTVKNAGVGTLTGEATLVESAAEFQLLDSGGGQVTSVPYSLGPEESAPVKVRFAPSTPDSFAGTMRLTEPGGGGVDVVLSGDGSALAVSPATGDFGSVTVGETGSINFVLTNLDTKRVTGTASLVTDAEFLLIEDGSEVSSVSYALDSFEATTVRVRLAPESAGDKTGLLVLSGGGGALIDLAGTAAAAP